MSHTTQGFTLIELTIVIVLIGIISAFAVPRFIDLSGSAKQSAVNDIAAALSAASSSNYAKRMANSAQGRAIANCTDVGMLLPGGLPANYRITSQPLSVGVIASCTLMGLDSTTASFSGVGIS